MQFNNLGLITPLLKSLETEGYTSATPIQQQAIPLVLEGRDVLGIAQTGTGKTAAFALPILQRLFQGEQVERPVQSEVPRPHSRDNRHPHRKAVAHSRRAVRALVLAPTRELASQIAESFRTYGRQTGLRTAIVFGGVGAGPQISALRSGVDILVACPGRLLDLISQGHVYLGGLQTLVLDEADRMLDMGFAPDIRRVLTHVPARRQTLLFSATMPAEIQRLADELLREPVRVEIAAVGTPAERVVHSTYFVKKADKTALLQRLLSSKTAGLPGDAQRRVLVFARTKRGADRVAEKLTRAGIVSDAIHGNKSQGQRERALEKFRSGESTVMVATDLAARGLDVDGVSHVINFDLPNEPETFVHRIGRTARAGASGYAISFCDAEESEFLADIEELIQQSLPQEHSHAHHCVDAHASHTAQKSRRASKASAGARQQRPTGQTASKKGSHQQAAEPRRGRREEQRRSQQDKQQRTNDRDVKRRHPKPVEGRDGRSEEPRSQFGQRKQRPNNNARPHRSSGSQNKQRGGDDSRRKDQPTQRPATHRHQSATSSSGAERTFHSARWSEQD